MFTVHGLSRDQIRRTETEWKFSFISKLAYQIHLCSGKLILYTMFFPIYCNIYFQYFQYFQYQPVNGIRKFAILSALCIFESDEAVKMENQGLKVIYGSEQVASIDVWQSGNMEMVNENVMVEFRLKFNQTATNTQQPTHSIAPHQSQFHVQLPNFQSNCSSNFVFIVRMFVIIIFSQ